MWRYSCYIFLYPVKPHAVPPPFQRTHAHTHTHTHTHTHKHTRARVPRPCGLFASTAPCTDQRHLFFGNSQVRHNLIIDSEWKAFLLFVCSEVKPGTALNTSSMQRHGEERHRLKSTPVWRFWGYSAWQLNATDTTGLKNSHKAKPSLHLGARWHSSSHS